MRIFQSANMTSATGKTLSYRDFKLMREVESPVPNPDKMARVIARAEALLGKEIPSLPASLYREFFINGNRANFEDKYFARRDMALTLSVAEWYEGRGRFTELLVDVVWAIMEESTWIIPAHLYVSPHRANASLSPVFGDNYLHGIDLFSAATCGLLSLVYHLCRDTLDGVSPIISRKLKWSIHERGVKSFLQYEPWWTGVKGNRTNNWCPWIISNILLQAALTEEELDVREAVIDRSIEYLDNFLNGYKEDGGCDEGPSYWGAAGASLLDCLELIDDMTDGKITVFNNELIKNIGDYIYKVNIDGIRYVNFADCPPKTQPNPSMIVRYGEKTNSPFLTSFGKTQAKHGDFFFHISHAYRTLRCLYSTPPEATDCPMPLYSCLPNLELMTARECDDTSKGTFLAAKGGNNDEMHNHNDVGNFMVYRNGEPVIIDAGVGQYTKQTFSSQRYELWFMQSGYHNLPSFNGIDQRNGAKFRAENTVFDEGKRSLRLQLRSAYPEEAGIESYERTTSLTGGVVTVEESISLKSEGAIAFHLMSVKEPRIVSDGVISLSEGMTLEYDKSLTASTEELDPVGMDTKKAWNSDKLYRMVFTTKAKKCNVTFTIR